MGKESNHWYDKTGKAAYTTLDSKGKERSTNLRDARKHGYVPSVTTILGVAAKPSLENWKVNQAISSALVLDKKENETDTEFLYRCKEHSRNIGKEAAEKGTIIHAMIEQGFEGGKETTPYAKIKEYLDKKFPNEKWTSEKSFCAKEGYGGKIDLHSESGIFVDFKTKDNLSGKEGARLVFDEHGMQLSAYANGCGFDSPERVSIFVDREDTGLIVPYKWDKDTHPRHLAMFKSLLTYWKLLKKYDSSKSIGDSNAAAA